MLNIRILTRKINAETDIRESCVILETFPSVHIDTSGDENFTQYSNIEMFLNARGPPRIKTLRLVVYPLQKLVSEYRVITAAVYIDTSDRIPLHKVK